MGRLSRGLLAWALLCKELGLKKRVIGFDSFSGFPPIYHANDSFVNFEMLHNTGAITKDHFEDTVRLKEVRTLIKQTEISVKNISSSEDFSENPVELLRRKIDFSKLDNIDLIVGDFTVDMVEQVCDQVCLAIFDCDLYESYRIALQAMLPHLVTGGICYLDEYYSLKFPGARIAVDEIVKQKKNLELKLVKRELDGFERWHLLNARVETNG